VKERDLKPAMPTFTGELTVGEIRSLRWEGGELSAAARKDLLARVRAGEPVTLEFDARTFVQRETPNRNFIRFREGAMLALARSFKGVPFLRDHGTRSLDARAGTVLASRLERGEVGEAEKKVEARSR